MYYGEYKKPLLKLNSILQNILNLKIVYLIRRMTPEN